MVDNSQETTHFGFQTVAKEQKADMVAHVFHSVASKYDVMNDLMSFGIHRLWKRFTIDCSGVRRGQTVLDLAGGTGDLTAKFSRMVGVTLSTFRRMRKHYLSLTTRLTASPSLSVCATLRIKTKHYAPCIAC